MPIDEIIVRGKRNRTFESGSGRLERFAGQQDKVFGGFRSDAEIDRLEDSDEGDDAEAAAVLLTATQAQEAMKPLPEVKVVAKRTVKPPPKFLGLTRSEVNLGARRAASLNRILDADMAAQTKRVLPEVKVIAKRIPKGSFLPFGGPLIFAADIIGQITNVISQRRLDEVGDLATRTVKPKPDTPVATIPAEVIPEIIVTAKRPRVKTPVLVRDFSDRDTAFFDAGVQFPSQKPTAVVFPIAAPRQSPKPKMPVDVNPFTFTRTNLRPGERASPRARPVTGPRSTLLNIPKRTTPGDLTRFNPQVVGLPITASSPQLAGGSCGPCPKPKEKKRNKCYKGLMKQGRFARNDKFIKWVEINCRTKREI